ncbi:hypothetical protein [Ferruginibacter sp.]|uniref:hypothetical protein n=1 Tax=Ferruginibacter sp. TaxID=1940288 RepID=UPI002658C0C6|nr:hypothetical protein [Ferruginibacter sp.]
MKSDISGNGASIKNGELKESLNEAVVTESRQEDFNRTFGSIDMWNLKKKQRTSLQMRRRYN